MNLASRAARTYYQANVRAWTTLRRFPTAFLVLLISAYLGTALTLHFSGHTAVGWVFTAVVGVPLLVLTWGGVLTIRK